MCLEASIMGGPGPLGAVATLEKNVDFSRPIIISPWGREKKQEVELLLEVNWYLHPFAHALRVNVRTVCWLESWLRMMIYLNAFVRIPFPYLELCTVVRIVKICYTMS